MFFIVSLEESHFGYRENVLVPQQNSQTSNEIGVDKSYKLPCFILTYSKAILHFHYSFNVQPSIFYMCFLDRQLCRFPHEVMGHYVWSAEWTFYASRNALMIIFLQHYPCTYINDKLLSSALL